MIDIFIPQPLSGARVVPFLASSDQGGKRLFQNLPTGSYDGIFRSVTDPAAAQVHIIPHEYAVMRSHPQVLASYIEGAKRAGKPVLLSAYQDDPEPLNVKGAAIFRASLYKSKQSKGEIVMPAYVEDLGAQYGHNPLITKDASVGFVGKAGFRNTLEAVRYGVRNYVVRQGADREGIYFRRSALDALRRHPSVKVNAIIRRSFSAHKDTIERPEEELRAEYVANMRDSLFTLAPRGDGNYSLRFYETLSMGRIPILIDTDMALPFEDKIAYDQFIVRVPWKDIARIGEYVDRFLEKPTEEIVEAQRKAREAFERYLYMPAFLRNIVSSGRLNV